MVAEQRNERAIGAIFHCFRMFGFSGMEWKEFQGWIQMTQLEGEYPAIWIFFTR